MSATPNKNLVLLFCAVAPASQAARLHKATCPILARAKTTPSVRKTAAPSREIIDGLIKRGYTVKKCEKCLGGGPGAYVPDEQRHTERITLRLEPETMSRLRAFATEKESTMADVIANALEAYGV
jgi:hypothetical protein